MMQTDLPLRRTSEGERWHHRDFAQWLLDLDTPVARPTLAEYEAMDADQRAAHDEARRQFVSRGVMVRNESYENLRSVVGHVMRENQYRVGGGHGVILSAASYTGKTTALRILMIDILKQCLRADPELLRRGEVPVVYVSLPSSGTPLGLYRMLADFLGLPIGTHETEASLEGMVQHSVNRSRTRLLIIDEAHNIKYGGVHAPKGSAGIRRLGDDIDCPIVLSGIDLEHTNLILGQEGAQIAQRYSAARMASYTSIGGRQARENWRRLAVTLLDAMPLLGRNDHGRTALADHLHRATGGRIGELNMLLTRIALDLIDAGNPADEVITHARIAAKAEELLGERPVPRVVGTRRGRSSYEG